MQPAFNLEKVTLLLKVSDIAIPADIRAYATKHGMTLKEEFHVTVIGFGLGKSILEQLQLLQIPPAKQTQVLQYLAVFSNTMSWKYQLGSDYFHLYKTYPNVQRESIIVLITLQGHEPFVTKIRELFGISLSLFPHITLYAKTSNPEEKPIMGIGVQDRSEFLVLKKNKIGA